jgi:hypothetical protein
MVNVGYRLLQANQQVSARDVNKRESLPRVQT